MYKEYGDFRKLETVSNLSYQSLAGIFFSLNALCDYFKPQCSPEDMQAFLFDATRLSTESVVIVSDLNAHNTDGTASQLCREASYGKG